MGRYVRSQPPVQAGGPLNSVREGRGRAWDSLGRLRAASRTGVRSRPMRTLWCWGPKSPDPAVSRPPAPSPSWASSAALTSSPGPAVSRARTRFKPARRRPRRAPPARASLRADLARAGHAGRGPRGGGHAAVAPPPRPPRPYLAPGPRLFHWCSDPGIFLSDVNMRLVIGLNARSGRNC